MEEKEAVSTQITEEENYVQISEEEYRIHTVRHIMAQGVAGAHLQDVAAGLNGAAKRECPIVVKIIGRSKPKGYFSAMGKLDRKKRKKTLAGVKTLKDIAGLRIIVAYEDDIQKVVDKIVELYPDADVKNYLPEGKKLSGYRGIHVIIMVKIVLDDEIVCVPVEIQIMTPLMSDWSLRQHDDYKGLTEDKQIGSLFRKLSKCYTEIEKIRMDLRELGVCLVRKNNDDFQVYYTYY